MLKIHDKNIGKYNLVGTFLVLIIFVFVVIMLSVNSSIDDFKTIEKDIKHKFLEDKKNEVKYKIENINILIKNLSEVSSNNNVDNKIFMKNFIDKINKNTDEIITVHQLDKSMKYYKELIEYGDYYDYSKYIDEETNDNLFEIQYFVLNTKFNWVFSIKFRDDIMHKEINNWKKGLDTLILNNIYVHISILFFFSIALLLVVYIINRFTNKTIAKCRESIKRREKDYKQNYNKLQLQFNNEVEKCTNQKKLIQKQSKMLALGDMLANISHQWRQPLTDISKTAKSIQEKIEKHQIATDEDIDKLRHIDNSALYLARTVDDFGVFLKADSLKIDFNVLDIVEKSLCINSSIIEKNNITVIKDFDEDIMIHNLSFGLLQALVNIIGNSKDALKKMKETDRYLFVQTKNKEDSVEITLTDTGGGIADEVMQNIFEPYFTTKQKTYGTGLGLHMAYNIINQNMSGKIVVSNENVEHESKIYTGASFTIILKLNENKWFLAK